MPDHKKKTHDRGIMAESAAELFLRAKGFEILARRYKTSSGEIDLIARDDLYLVFIEVKARPTIDDALFSITPRMRARITQAANHFISENPQYQQSPMRFDMVAVKLPFSIRHMEHVWMD